MDTDAKVMAISESTLQTLGQLEVSMPDKKLCGPNSAPLDLRGSLTVTISEAAQMWPGNICHQTAET